MKYLYFLKYNNYANRVMKSEDTVDDYLGGTGSPNLIRMVEDVKLWNPNDGIMTVYTSPSGVDFSTEPDYLITSDDGYTIDTRWFVVETVRVRRGQFQCTLRRDVFAEAWADLMSSTAYISRAILPNSSALNFNPEPISVNQILTKEELIKDKTGCPWLVFYGAQAPSPVIVNLANETYDLSTPDHTVWEAEHEIYYLPNGNADIQMWFTWQRTGENTIGWMPMLSEGNLPNPAATPYYPYTIDAEPYYTPAVYPKASVETYIRDYIRNMYDLKTQAEGSLIYNEYNGKILYDTTNQKFYTISVSIVSGTQQTRFLNSPNPYHGDVSHFVEEAGNFPITDQLLTSGNYFVQSHSNIGYYQSPTAATKQNLVFGFKCNLIRITLTETVPLNAITAKVPTAGTICKDAPYYMWCMPYGDISVTVDGRTITPNKERNLAAITAFSKANTSATEYDFQILPYCPLPEEFINPNGSITVNGHPEICDTATMIDGSSNMVGAIFACPNCTFSRVITYDGTLPDERAKYQSIVYKWRLSAPNYSSSFDFSVAKNGGLTGFTIKCTYVPIQPYIRVAPIWGGLYGASTFSSDPRGLICGGDYSLARLNDAWVQYQENNKNYQTIFDREIAHLDVARKYERWNQIGSAVAGAGAGAAAGAMVGGPWGAVAGGVLSAAAGVTDVMISEQMYKENKSYATDMHELQLGNVQAMPKTLVRTTAFNVDNRYFPIFSTYKCTEEEQSAVVSFIVNRSMNVGIISSPSAFIENRWHPYSDGSDIDRGFIQGTIININTKFDTHFVDELNNEFQKGVYLR